MDIKIFDDDSWEPDEELYVELYDPTKADLPRYLGLDTRCGVTIIDDDKPGTLKFAEASVIAYKEDDEVTLKIIRSIGCDGVVTIDYATKTIEGPENAIAGVDFEAITG